MSFFSEREKNQIKASIIEAESKTNGEIRVHIFNRRKVDDVYDTAIKTFYMLEMDKTEFHNGVLIFIAPKAKQFAIIGDEAIHQRVSQEFWNAKRDEISLAFQKGEAVKAIVMIVKEIGTILTEYFPKTEDDFNELPDDVSESE